MQQRPMAIRLLTPVKPRQRTLLVVTAHYHGVSEVVEPLVTAHSHTRLTAEDNGDLLAFDDHTHDTAVSAHKHDDEAEYYR